MTQARVGVTMRRRRINVTGAVQGVGFRPFVYRLATELGLKGSVSNCSFGASIEVEGAVSNLDEFLVRLERDKPAVSSIWTTETVELDPAGLPSFRIVESESQAAKTAVVLPDLAPCPECLSEVRDPASRRFAYPFTNCTNCGPRFSIILGIPYDRPNTTMAQFEMCPDCRAEYTDVSDRRFHAQPIACPRCGPKLEIEIADLAQALTAGKILALKGVGGFQLLCDARNSAAVRLLRQRKQRAEKPFAVMFPDLDSVRQDCVLGAAEARLLVSSAAPIVLLRKAAAGNVAPEVDMSSPYTGAMLPSSPLHRLLLTACRFPIVATSGNLSDEPIATDNTEAKQRLAGIADVFGAHNRPIARPCDDSVVRFQCGRETVLRRARGYAPLPVLLRQSGPNVLALGAHLKNTVAIAIERQVFLSQHIGDLETFAAFEAFRRAIDDLCRLYDFKPSLVACDLHPDYVSTQHAATLGLPVRHIQHHMAHVAACAAENEIAGPYLGVAWDGTGYGTDGVIWGSEFFAVTASGFERIAHLRPFSLPGGEGAIRDCRRTALSLLIESGIDPSLSGLPKAEIRFLTTMLRRGINSPTTTSMGRLFDAVGVLTGVAQKNKFEGQAAMLLEAAVSATGDDRYPMPVAGKEIDWRPMLVAVIEDVRRRAEPGDIARRFHNTLAYSIAAVARNAQFEKIVLSGGVFQNCYLTERVVRNLTADGFRVYTHQRIPPNDGGIALGQAILARSLGCAAI